MGLQHLDRPTARRDRDAAQRRRCEQHCPHGRCRGETRSRPADRAPCGPVGLIRVDAENEPDLFWSLRGGGGSFGVTAIEFDPLPLREIYAGGLFFSAERPAMFSTAGWSGPATYRRR